MEDTLLKGTLSELRMIFVKAPEQQKLIEAEMARQEELKKHTPTHLLPLLK